MGRPPANSVNAWCAITPLGKLMVNTCATHKTITRSVLIDGVTLFTRKQAQVEGFKIVRVRVSKIVSHP